MFSAVIFTIAILALCQFGLFYWRAVVAGVAALPVSDRILEAAHLRSGALCGSDFERLASLYGLTPVLEGGDSNLGWVGIYYRAVKGLGAAFGKLSPAVGSWSERESVLCARYAAVQIERRLQSNLVQAAAIRSC